MMCTCTFTSSHEGIAGIDRNMCPVHGDFAPYVCRDNCGWEGARTACQFAASDKDHRRPLCPCGALMIPETSPVAAPAPVPAEQIAVLEKKLAEAEAKLTRLYEDGPFPDEAELARTRSFGDLALDSDALLACLPAQAWAMLADAIHRRILARNKFVEGSVEDVNYLVLGFDGEAGEVVNVWKKIYRGDAGFSGQIDGALKADLEEELADVCIYQELLEHTLKEKYGVEVTAEVIMRKLRKLVAERGEKWGLR